LPVVGHLDHDPLALRLDLGHLTHVDTQHADAVALVEADGAREVGGDLHRSRVLERPPQTARDHEAEHDGDRDALSEPLSEPSGDHLTLHPSSFSGPTDGSRKPQMWLSNQRPLPIVLLNTRTNGANRRMPSDSESWLRCSIPVSRSSLVSTGPICSSLSSTSPRSCFESSCVPCSIAVIACLRFCSSLSSELPSFMSLTSSLSRPASVPLTCLVFFNRPASCW